VSGGGPLCTSVVICIRPSPQAGTARELDAGESMHQHGDRVRRSVVGGRVAEEDTALRQSTSTGAIREQAEVADAHETDTRRAVRPAVSIGTVCVGSTQEGRRDAGMRLTAQRFRSTAIAAAVGLTDWRSIPRIGGGAVLPGCHG